MCDLRRLAFFPQQDALETHAGRACRSSFRFMARAVSWPRGGSNVCSTLHLLGPVPGLGYSLSHCERSCTVWVEMATSLGQMSGGTIAGSNGKCVFSFSKKLPECSRWLHRCPVSHAARERGSRSGSNPVSFQLLEQVCGSTSPWAWSALPRCRDKRHIPSWAGLPPYLFLGFSAQSVANWVAGSAYR